jgi:hypothetical protein
MMRTIRRRKLKAPRGQAMIEYSIITHFILFFGALGLMPAIVWLFRGLNTYYDSVYLVLQSSSI